MEKSHQYFSGQAKSYQEKSIAFPWSWIRKRESKALFALMGNLGGDCVMDLGCGAGYYTRLLLNQSVSKVFAVDASFEMVKHLPKDSRLISVVADAGLITFKRPLDTIICAGLLEFVSDPLQVLSNIHNQFSSSVDLFLLVPFQNFFGQCYRFFHNFHGLSIQLFSYGEMEHLANETGWEIVAKQRVFPFTLIMHWRCKE